MINVLKEVEIQICTAHYIPVGDYFVPTWTQPEENAPLIMGPDAQGT